MSVSELTGHLKAVVEGTFPPMWVAGEISDLARPRSGHLYFTLKDDAAQIRGVIWRSVAQRLKFDLDDGQAVLCYGGLDVYAARGSYQLVVRKVQPQGVGALQLAFEQLRSKLEAEGLFDPARKRPLPVFPATVAIITSATGAALRDFLEAARHRYRGTAILVIPAQVQGRGAARTIVDALRTVEAVRPQPDAVILARGGGSLEDLWCFNEEAVIRAVADCPIPTVSAIGHEIDVTLCDLVADVRALTPTDAATRVLPDAGAIAAAFRGWQDRLTVAIRSRLRERASHLRLLSERPVLRSPLEFVHHRSRMLDEWDTRAKRAIERHLEQARSRVALASSAASALSPLQVLSRGYSVTYDENRVPIHRADQVVAGQVITTRLREGTLHSKIIDAQEAQPPKADQMGDGRP